MQKEESKVDDQPEQIVVEKIIDAQPIILEDVVQEDHLSVEKVIDLNNQSDQQQEEQQEEQPRQASEKNSSKSLIEVKQDGVPDVKTKQVISYSFDYEQAVQSSVFDFLNKVYATSIEMRQRDQKVQLAEKEQKIAIYIKMFLGPIYEAAIEQSQPKVEQQPELQQQSTFLESDDDEISNCLSQDRQSWEDTEAPKSSSSAGVLE